MKGTPILNKLKHWYKSAGLYIHPARQLPGRWKLYEYYTEPEGELVNIKEEHLEKEKQYLELYFEPHGHMGQTSNLPVQFLKGNSSCTWQTSRNFITLRNSQNSAQAEEFQYAVVDGNLKLLKKDGTGRIEFFGFFRKIELMQ